MKVACIVPARMASSRYPGKPIATILGHPMIEHVWRRLKTAKYVHEIVIATCDEEIRTVAEGFGAKVIMTAPTHVRGTDRVAEAATHIQADLIINVQGDEPMVDPSSLDRAIEWMQDHPTVPCLNLVSPISDWETFVSRDVVKTVMDGHNRVLYFSRQPIPTQKPDQFKGAHKQIGIYLFKKDFLLTFTAWPQTPLECIEGVDMMRILERGGPIQGFMAHDSISVDTPADHVFAEGVIRKDLLYQKVFGVAV